jgi:putative addiction module component (TIGR02574 family)
VSAIWNSIFHDLEQLPISQKLRDELDSELESHRRNPESSLAWEDVDRELFGDK